MRANVTANLLNLSKLPSTRVFVAAENGWVEVLELVALFLLKTGAFMISAKTGRRFPYMLYRALLRFFEKREGKIHSNFDKCPTLSLKLFFLYCELYLP